MAQLQLQLLGGFDARDADGSSIPLPTRKAQALLAYLALPPGRWHTREHLAALLWGRSRDEQARNSLRQTLSTLRTVLGEHDANALLTRGESVALDETATDTDAGRLEALASEEQNRDPVRVDSLYQGELLKGFGLAEETFAEWLEVERRRMAELAERVLVAGVDHCLEREQTNRGIDLAAQVLAIEPLREDIHRALMQLYVQAGRRGAALDQYERCRKLLKQEIGTGPEPETERLANEIRMRPRTEYTRCGDVDIAYQVLGEGPVDLLYIPGWVSHVEYAWEYPGCARFLRGLAAFSRLIVFDKRGCGLSEREVGTPNLEDRMQDIHAVLDAVGSKQAVILGVSEGGGLACLFAASSPERTTALVLHGCFAKRMRSSDYPWGYSQDEFEDGLRQIEEDWGGRMTLMQLAPSAEIDSDFHDWFSRYLRNSASRQAALKIARFSAQIDVRDVLPSIGVPTLVIRREGDVISSKWDSEYLTTHIPNAELRELPGEDHVPFYGDVDALVAEIKSFVTARYSWAEFRNSNRIAQERWVRSHNPTSEIRHKPE